jgi:hypothetical protein
VLFENFCHQPIDSSAHPCDLMEQICTAFLGIKRSLQRLDLPPDAPNPTKKLGLLTNCVIHIKLDF